MPLVIRPFSEADVDVAGDIARSMQPPYLAAQGMTLWQEVYHPAAGRFCLAATRSDNTVIGCGALWRVGGEKFRLDLMVHPRWQRQGVGGNLLARLLEEARQRGAARVQARARDDRPTALSFLQNRGFVETHRMQRFSLCLAAVDPSAPRMAIEQIEKRGVSLTTLAAVQAQGPYCLRKLYELYLAVIPSWPDPDPDPVPAEPPSFNDYLRLLDPHTAAPETILLAMAGDRLVGFCGSLGTAVHPAYRGWGIATAMEARIIEQSSDQGCESLIGASANPAMRAVYAKLGYQRTFAEVRLLRRLADR
jgi:[ribosomal protein S18]-alanine N-acetyltransferase